MSDVYVQAVDAGRPDIEALLKWLQLEILPSDEPMDVSKGHWWIAYDGTRPVGFAGVVQSQRWIDVGYLCRAGVIESYRGKGIQKRLIKVRERKAHALKWNYLITDTTANPASANSLISCGFKMFRPSKPWSYDSACYWIKKMKRKLKQ